VVGVDPQHGDATPSALDLAVLETGAAFAGGLGVELRVVHAWTFEVMPVLGRVSVDRERNRRAAAEAHHEAAERFARLLAAAPFPIRRRNAHLLLGDPALVLPAVAAELRADVVVVGSVVRGAVTDLVSGHLEDRLLGDLPCSLVVVKPLVDPAEASPRPRGEVVPPSPAPP
jgi:nucleotide-binding universal stress UspA family protein